MPKKPVAAPVVRKRASVSVEDAILGCEAYEIFLRGYDRITRNLDVKALTKEVLNMHATRRTRRLDSASILADAQKELIEANAQNSSFRSRATEIRMQLFAAHADLAELTDRFWRYVTAEFDSELKALGYKTSATQWNYLSTLLSASQTKLARINAGIEICKLIIDDMDAAGYSLLRINETLKINARDR